MTKVEVVILRKFIDAAIEEIIDFNEMSAVNMLATLSGKIRDGSLEEYNRTIEKIGGIK